MVGACIGACVLGMIKDGFLILGASSFALDLVTGLTILLAMILNVQIRGRLPCEGGAGRSAMPSAWSSRFSRDAEREGCAHDAE
jgi:hypothetical protein